jgi:hypothetical protein
MNRSVNFLGIASPVFVVAIFLVGCNTYRLSDPSQGTSEISGGVLRTDQSDVEVVFVPLKIDDQYFQIVHRRNGPFRRYTVEAGEHSFEFQRDKNSTESYHRDKDIRPIDARLSPGRSYRVTGKIVIGNAIKYWIEDIESGEPVSQIYYDLEEIRDDLELNDSIDTLDWGNAARLEISAKDFFANKKLLTPGRDCFGLIGQTVSSHTSIWTEGFFPVTGTVPKDYSYRSYEDICFDVKMGHRYELRGFSERRAIGSSHPSTFMNRNKIWYELWDVTDESLLQTITPEELKVKVKEF